MADRASGILLHPTSFPSRGGIGDFGPAAYQFLDWLAQARQGLWQILPLGPVGYGNSPYSSISAFAGNPLLISLERLADRGLLPRDRINTLDSSVGHVDYERVRATKLPLLEEAARTFLSTADGNRRAAFDRFCRDHGWWLDGYVLFVALRNRYPYGAWNRWPRELVRREPAALERASHEMAEELNVGRALQFFFFEQWRALRRACAQRGIRIVGDVAIFVSYDSADVWTHPDIFRLNQDLEPEVVAGVPPDAFSATGQRWGNPVYRWDVLQSRGYDWWIQRMRFAFEACDIIRLDHFRGFEAYWEIPASEPTAVHGRWARGPNDDLFHALRNALGSLPLIAEDLGYITPEVHALRERFGLPSMKVLQFAFGDPGAHMYLPHRYQPNTVVYTGTHDNDTTPGWLQHGASEAEKRAVAAYMGSDPAGMHWAMIRGAVTSPARLCVIPLQDVLGLGSEARMNVPSRAEGNWAWRYQPDALKADIAQRLAEMAEVADRQPSAPAQQGQWEGAEEFAA